MRGAHWNNSGKSCRVLTMIWSLRKKLHGLFFASYVVLTLAGAFSFIALPLHSVYFEIRNPESNNTCTAENNYSIQQPAQNVAFVFKTRNTQAPIHSGFQRVAYMFTSSVIGNNFYKQSLISSAKVQYIILKNTISLNLRI
jgi:hypothetical protein